jgi:hypothetical protein
VMDMADTSSCEVCVNVCVSVARTKMAAAFLAKSPVSDFVKTLPSVLKLLYSYVQTDGRDILIGTPQGKRTRPERDSR